MRRQNLRGCLAKGKGSAAFVKLDLLSLDSIFVDLIDCPKILPKIFGILGWNIKVYHSHLNYTPPNQYNAEDQTFAWHWHQGNGRVRKDLRQDQIPLFNVKVGFYLSDNTKPDSGNTFVLPSKRDALKGPDDIHASQEGAVPMIGKPGTAMIFDPRTWHSASPNLSDTVRRALFLGYGYRWLQPMDKMDVAYLEPESDPIRRQLLDFDAGYNEGGYSSRYYLAPEEVPLFHWMQEMYP